ncbi:bifunctional hydroxymethylpyrimidine kinase/phosphomethylpyrimidine kinase [Pseudobutyrivibrio xylanivorans]|uniref:Hydroxymethylpyrimidine/phosphomethylpyrimidine kinase n=1 Tax=Pseudobutyrivibrio xylanivorans TaxID=185007 RepID=A0A5P6VSJ7_PSEXY|nr:bifunctional hydroxymethylpyrimidine kinase/phosphomethylpyrimidine kinase [Pseudobutyrivibrio xylanivorans]QFJ53821.1 bifunctional hydroxymethylpyrimidine kinase/phosphomethylpyrimidine kinase [Pseudobutyrivibrio xylanivorans]
MKIVLSIAGSDSSGGAGIQADLKTMCAHGVYGMTAITALTAQNTTGVFDIVEASPEFLDAQINACLSDIPADAIKIGMIPSVSQIEVVTKNIRKYDIKNVVLDPVMVSTSGKSLSKSGTIEKLEELLFPLAKLITPNIPEAEKLAGIEISDRAAMEQAARILGEKYGCGVLLKGGHAAGDASDVLYEHGGLTWYEGTRIHNPNTHGTGCTLSSAIACNLALGYELTEAINLAKKYLTKCIQAQLNLGNGNGPLAFPLRRRCPEGADEV